MSKIRTNMSQKYKVIITYSNGYRCCCMHSWDTVLEFKKLEEAVKCFPIKGLINAQTEILEASLYETNGKLIGSGFLDYPRIKNYRYKASRWHGFLLEERFDVVIGPEENETWDNFLNRINNGNEN